MRDGKLGFIQAFFNDLDERLAFLQELYDKERENEAMLLCCCYIDGLANNLYPGDEGSHRNFVKVIREFGQIPWLTRIHPRQLRESLQQLRGAKARKATALAGAFPATEPLELPTEEEFLAHLRSDEQEVLTWLKEQMWRGTLASIVYTRLRVPAVHGLGAPAGIVFDDSRISGQRVPRIDFALLRDVARRICAEARQLSEASRKWFGRW